VIFNKKFGDVSEGITATAPVFIAKDRILVGHAGGDSGIRGSIAALSASTGEELWRRTLSRPRVSLALKPGAAFSNGGARDLAFGHL